MKQLIIDGRQVEYQEWPARQAGMPPLVLLHEGLGSVALWRDFPAELAAHTRAHVIAYSRPGYGQSDPYPEARTPRYMHDEAERILPAFLAALGIQQPLLVGHSDGGSIGLLYAARFPKTLAGLVVMAPHAFVEEVTLAGIRAAAEAWEKTEWPQRLARYHRAAPRVFADWRDCWLSPEFRDWNIEDDLSAIRCPVLALQGIDDEYGTLRQIEIIAERVPGSRLLALANCAHSPHREQPKAVLQAIADFLPSCR
ncbi:MAG: alpha/beta hydrolase [Dechloromonas sp.]|nr:alpha/beta hydrolase [Dechloromonas sp.]